MPFKRYRTEGSSSCVKAPVPIDAAGSMKVGAASQPSPPNSTTVASPERSGGSDASKIGGFLEQCHYCRKRIDQDSEVFMYGGLCAFCTPECRHSQILLDQLAAKRRP